VIRFVSRSQEFLQTKSETSFVVLEISISFQCTVIFSKSKERRATRPRALCPRTRGAHCSAPDSMVMNSRETGQSFSGDLFKSLHRGARPPGTGPNETTTFVPNAVVQPVGSDIAGFPVYHHIPGLGGPDEGPWSDRCCETSDKCCCGFFHDCWYPAHHCCRCPPWFLVVAFVLTCVSFLVNFGVLTPFFRAFVRCVFFSEAVDTVVDHYPPSRDFEPPSSTPILLLT
jgi:hypothetical protein